MKLNVTCECEVEKKCQCPMCRVGYQDFAVFDKESGQIVLSTEAVNNMMTDEQKQEWKKNDWWFKDEAYKQNSD